MCICLGDRNGLTAVSNCINACILTFSAVKHWNEAYFIVIKKKYLYLVVNCSLPPRDVAVVVDDRRFYCESLIVVHMFQLEN